MISKSLDAQVRNEVLSILGLEKIRARNQREATREKIRNIVYSVGWGSALILGGIFLYGHPEYIDYAGRAVTEIINNFYR